MYEQEIEKLKIIDTYLKSNDVSMENKLDILWELACEDEVEPKCKILQDIYSMLLNKNKDIKDLIKKYIIEKIYRIVPKKSISAFSETLKPYQIMAYGKYLKDRGRSYIDINCKNLKEFTKSQWVALTLAIKHADIKSIAFTGCNLSQLPEIQWRAMSEALSTTTLNKLDLQVDHLNLLSEAQLLSLEKIILSTGLEDLGLSGVCLHFFTDAQFKILLSILKKANIKTLNLWSNNLGGWPDDRLKDLAIVLKESAVTALNLSGNSLNKKLIIFLSFLGPNLLSNVNLTINELYKLKENEWINFLDDLRRSNVTNINLSNNGLSKTQLQQVTDICKLNHPKEKKEAIVVNPNGKLSDIIKICFFKEWDLKKSIQCNSGQKISYSTNNKIFEMVITDQENEILYRRQNS